MTNLFPDMILVSDTITQAAILQLAENQFAGIVKGVIDIETGLMALGGELHADEEAFLLENGAKQENLWGFNIYIDDNFPNTVEFDSLINIRPRQNNRSRHVEDPIIRQEIENWLKKKIV